MCCEATETPGLPAEVIETLAHYRRLLDERGWDWGDDQIEYFRWVRFSWLTPAVELLATGDWPTAIRSVIGHDVPAGAVVVRVDAGGGLRAMVGPARTAIAGRTVTIDVVVDSAADADLSLALAGREVRVAPLGATVERIEIDGADPVFTVVLDDETLHVAGAVRTSAAAELRLLSPRCARWSVTDSSGGAWFPEGVLAKWDAQTGLSSTVTTSPLRCRPKRCMSPAPEASSSSEQSSTCSRPRTRRASSSAIRRGCSIRPPTAGTAATCTST